MEIIFTILYLQKYYIIYFVPYCICTYSHFDCKIPQTIDQHNKYRIKTLMYNYIIGSFFPNVYICQLLKTYYEERLNIQTHYSYMQQFAIGQATA